MKGFLKIIREKVKEPSITLMEGMSYIGQFIDNKKEYGTSFDINGSQIYRGQFF